MDLPGLPRSFLSSGFTSHWRSLDFDSQSVHERSAPTDRRSFPTFLVQRIGRRVVGIALVCAPWVTGCRGQTEVPSAPPLPNGASEEAVRTPSQGLEHDLAETLAFGAERPVYEQPLGIGLETPSGLSSLSAKACGTCHRAIYEEWAVSTHAHSWTDPQFQAEIGKSGNRWLCLNCHTPLLSQQDWWPTALQEDDVERPVLVENAAFDAELREEGITCAACHVRKGVIHGPGREDSVAPHPVVADETFRDTRVCGRCHQAVATYPGKGFICIFDTGKEWAAGPYAGEGVGCVDCHMPRAERPAAEGGPVRSVARHWWRGAGIPKVSGVQPPVEANPPGLGVSATWGEGVLLLELRNDNAGHRLPTGDPERWVQVDVNFQNSDGVAVSPTWSQRIGQTWKWWPEPVKLGDNRLEPREARTHEVPIPAGAVVAVLTATSHRMTAELARYHHLEDYPLSLVTHEIRVLPGSP